MLRNRISHLNRGSLHLQLSRSLFSTGNRGTKEASFSGDVSDLYDRIAVQHAHRDGPWKKIVSATEYCLRNRQAPYRILDIASGPGEPGISIAKAFPHTHVIITDISQDMINKAKEQTAGLDNTECLVADSENLSQFADNSFDVVTCCFGFMYNADKEKAFRESYRVLKPGGSLIATYWLSMPAGAFTRAAMNAVVSQKSTRPSTHIINPMCMSKAGVVTALAEQANFTDLSFTESHYPFNFGQDEATVFAMITLPIHDMIAEAQQQGRHDAVEIGKKAFFKELNESSFVTKTEEGTIVHGNKFEMIVAKKSEK